MPTYKVGNEPLKPRKSMREVLCEHCGKIMGKALFTRPFAGLTAEKAIELWPYLKVDIKLHENVCPSSKELPGPADSARLPGENC
jgi:hypothetical protein